VVPMARKALMGCTNGLLGDGAGGGGGARPDLVLLTTFSPVFFFSCVFKSRVSGVGARVGRGARRGVSQCKARTSGGPGARFQPFPRPQPVTRMPCNLLAAFQPAPRRSPTRQIPRPGARANYRRESPGAQSVVAGPF
jgi:hypothetical protein